MFLNLLGLALLTLSWDKNWDSHSLLNGYPSFYPRIALVAPSPGENGFSDTKAPTSYQMSHRMCLDTEELARRSAIYASLADSMVASVIEELSPKDERTKLLMEKARSQRCQQGLRPLPISSCCAVTPC